MKKKNTHTKQDIHTNLAMHTSTATNTGKTTKTNINMRKRKNKDFYEQKNENIEGFAKRGTADKNC